jgi:hypothetical protein
MDYFFDVPVYRLARDKYEAEQKAYIESVMFETETLREYYGQNRDQAEMMHEHLWKRYGGPWQFNEIIGYIRLYFYGSQIRGEWWRLDAKRVTRTRTKMFLNLAWKVVYEEEIPSGSTSKQIYELILFYLKRAQEDKNLKRFYIDTSVFERIGPCVDWKAAFQALNFFRRKKADQKKKLKH